MGIDITKEAADHILDFLHQNNMQQPVRLSLKKTQGCADLAPAFFGGVNIIPEEDVVLDKHGLTLVCNLAMLPELDGVTVDLRVGNMSQILVLTSPNLQSCGCGQAVTPVK